MRQSFALLLLFVAGCGTAHLDTEAAQEYVRSSYSAPHLTVDITLVEGPEYATIPKIPRDHIASGFPDRSASGGVRVRFNVRDGNRTDRDDWVVWVASDHKAVGFSGNPDGDNWRPFVQSIAEK